MRLSFVFIIFILSTAFTAPAGPAKKAEVNGYYKTYADYAANKIELMDEAVNCDFIAGRLFVRFKKGGQIVKVKCKDIWGFKFKSALFRDFHEKTTDYPCAVVSTGKIVYYEMGSQHIDALINNIKIEDGIQDWGHACYFSKTLSSDMMSVSNPAEFEKFKATFASDKALIACMDKDNGKIRSYKACVTAYNKSAQVKKKKAAAKKK